MGWLRIVVIQSSSLIQGDSLFLQLLHLPHVHVVNAWS